MYYSETLERFKKVQQAIEKTPPPPSPDDTWATTLRRLNLEIERTVVYLTDRSQQEVPGDE